MIRQDLSQPSVFRADAQASQFPENHLQWLDELEAPMFADFAGRTPKERKDYCVLTPDE